MVNKIKSVILGHAVGDALGVPAEFFRWYYDGEYTPAGVTFDIGGTCCQAILNNTRCHKKPLECGMTEVHSRPPNILCNY